MSNGPFLPNAPSKTLWILALLIGIAGVVLHYYHVDNLSKYSYEMLLIGFFLLVIGTAYRRI